MRITILLVDAHRLLRECLRTMIEQQPDLCIIAEAEDGHTAIRVAEQTCPDIALVDSMLPGLNGIDLTRRIRETAPNTRVIVMASHSKHCFMHEMYHAGASVCLPKNVTFTNLVKVIRDVAGNRSYLSKLVSDPPQYHYGHETTAKTSVFMKLSIREREILQLIAEGDTAPAIAEKLCISVNTAKAHRRHIISKLQLHSTAELTLYAIREGLTSL